MEKKIVHILVRQDDYITNIQFPYRYWTPVIIHKKRLYEKYNIKIKFFFKHNRYLLNCDILIIENKIHLNKKPLLFFNFKKSLKELKRIRKKGSKYLKIIWFDAWDSSSTIDLYTLFYIDKYLKMQIFKNIDDYQKKYFDFRSYTDFYMKTENYSAYEKFHKKNLPSISEELITDLKNKLYLSWNFGYSFYYSPFLAVNSLEQFYKNQFWIPEFTSPKKKRSIDLQARFSLIRRHRYLQRQLIHPILLKMNNLNIACNGRLSKHAFLEEMTNAKAVISPFGAGEICYRDFETIISGALLLKPEMKHLETWPDIYEDGKTCITFKWDFSDLKEKIYLIINDDEYRISIAEKAQEKYLQFWKNTTGDGFVDYFYNLLNF